MSENTEAIICFILFSHQIPILFKLNSKFKTNLYMLNMLYMLKKHQGYNFLKFFFRLFLWEL